jgi:hypothetical protein
MDELLCHGAVLIFDPEPGWQWSGWNGRLEIGTGTGKSLSIRGKFAIVSNDIVALAVKVIGISYTATGFSDTPGTVIAATIHVESGSTNDMVEIPEGRVCDEKTVGSFLCQCRPSMKIGTPPVPDPLSAVRKGRWRVFQPGQDRISTGR